MTRQTRKHAATWVRGVTVQLNSSGLSFSYTFVTVTANSQVYAGVVRIVQIISIFYNYLGLIMVVCFYTSYGVVVGHHFLPSSASTSTKSLAEVSLVLGIIFPPTPNRKSILALSRLCLNRSN